MPDFTSYSLYASSPVSTPSHPTPTLHYLNVSITIEHINIFLFRRLLAT